MKSTGVFPTNAARKETRPTCSAVSEGRKEKDKAIRAQQEKRLIHDLERLRKRIECGNLKKPEKIHEAIGRLKERYPRVARYYQIEYQKTSPGKRTSRKRRLPKNWTAAT